MAGNKHILLKNAQTTAIVDEDDYDWLMAYGRWWMNENGYAVCNKGKKKVRMHRLINKTEPEFITDHINGNRLDNRKENLRTVDHSENAQVAGFTGRKYDLPKYVSWDVEKNMYVATFKKRKRFDNIEDAVQFTKDGK